MSEPSKKKGKPEERSKRPSSPGDSPLTLTPFDVSPDSAAWRDLTPRNITSSDPEEREDALLDEAIELTFPASDPIAVSPLRKERTTAPGSPETRALDKAIELTFPASDPIAPPSVSKVEGAAPVRADQPKTTGAAAKGRPPGESVGSKHR
jgi:hypothetical protein